MSTERPFIISLGSSFIGSLWCLCGRSLSQYLLLLTSTHIWIHARVLGSSPEADRFHCLCSWYNIGNLVIATHQCGSANLALWPKFLHVWHWSFRPGGKSFLRGLNRHSRTSGHHSCDSNKAASVYPDVLGIPGNTALFRPLRCPLWLCGIRHYPLQASRSWLLVDCRHFRPRYLCYRGRCIEVEAFHRSIREVHYLDKLLSW